MPTVAIIGASRGIGLELVRQYADANWKVIATVRDCESPGAIADIAGDVSLYPLDVVDTDAITELAIALAGTTIDVLIHNAGVKDGYPPEVVMQVNADAPILVTEVLLGAVTRSAAGRIVLMSSQMGARHGQTGSLGTYGDSKAALNDAFRSRVTAWGAQDVIAVVMHPGWVQTSMGGSSAPVTVVDSAQGIRAVVDGLTANEHGKFLTWLGDELAW